MDRTQPAIRFPAPHQQPAVRPGLHCAPYIQRVIGTFPDGAVRASPGAFSTADDVERLADALAEIKL